MKNCFLIPEPDNSPESIFHQVWDFTDREYSFFEYKNIDWDSVYKVYASKLQEEMSDEELFSMLADMLFTLRDGHVNLASPFNRSRNRCWYLDYPPNYNYSILKCHYFQGKEQYVGPFILMDFGKPVAVLTNRLCYSATNYMVALMDELPDVTTIGDNTGGGGGIPAYTELSNGWLLRVSSSQIFTARGLNVENGIPPDKKIDLSPSDEMNNRDTILDYALAFIRSK